MVISSPAPLDGLCYLHMVEFMGIEHDLTQRDSDVLVVTFPGAVNRRAIELPYFEWGRSMASRSESYLRLSDPTLRLNDHLSLGWFIGHGDCNMHHGAAAFIAETAASLGASRVVTVGSSGGGFAALAVAAHIPDSTGLAFSPSTTVDRVSPGHTANLLRAAFPEMADYSELHATWPERVSLEALYATDRPNKFYLIQNAGDDSRMGRSFIPFAASLGLGPDGGSTAGGRWNLIVEPHGDGHIPPPKERFHHWLDTAIAVSDRLVPTN